jgi:hypothetical protein
VSRLSGQNAISVTGQDGSQFSLADSTTPLPLKLLNAGGSPAGISCGG